jgi:hypothetical protein
VFGIKNAPAEFSVWAKDNGAVEVENDNLASGSESARLILNERVTRGSPRSPRSAVAAFRKCVSVGCPQRIIPDRTTAR